MEVAGTKSSITLRALALTGVVAQFHALETEDVITLGENSILLAHVAHRACQFLLVHSYFLLQDLPIRLIQ